MGIVARVLAVWNAFIQTSKDRKRKLKEGNKRGNKTQHIFDENTARRVNFDCKDAKRKQKEST